MPKTRLELLNTPRDQLTRDEKREADSGVTPTRLTEIQALLNDANPTEQATTGFKALQDLWRAFQSERDDLARADEKEKSPQIDTNRFF